MPGPTVISKVALRFSDNEILVRAASVLSDGTMAIRVDIVGGLTLSVGDINIGAVNVLNVADTQINPMTDETGLLIVAALGGGGSLGASHNEYGEAAAVASAALTTVVSFTVPVGKTFFLRHASGSGTTIGKYVVDADGVTLATKRSNFSGWNVDFFFNADNQQGIKVVAGKVVRVRVIHPRPIANDFEAQLNGRLV